MHAKARFRKTRVFQHPRVSFQIVLMVVPTSWPKKADSNHSSVAYRGIKHLNAHLDPPGYQESMLVPQDLFGCSDTDYPRDSSLVLEASKDQL